MEKRQVFSLWYFVGAFIVLLLIQSVLFPTHTWPTS